MSTLADQLRDRCTVDDNGCWIWPGSTSMGYGTKRHEGKVKYVHRLMYEMLVAPIPAGLHIDHLCCVKACCNPAHLEPVTCAENLRRAPLSRSTVNAAKTHCAKGHPYSGENLGRRKLNGWRRCRTCERALQREARLRKRARMSEAA